MVNEKNLSVDDVIDFLYGAKLTPGDRERIARAFNDSLKVAKLRAGCQFVTGDKVQFTVSSGRYRGRVVTGTVARVNRMTIHLSGTSDGLQWRVSPTFLKKV